MSHIAKKFAQLVGDSVVHLTVHGRGLHILCE
jgi:hypothetical protein